MKILAIAAASLGLAITASPALAETSEPMSMDINVAEIDLSTPAGQKLLDRKIEHAARTVCRITDPMTGTRIQSYEARRCLAKARASAKQQVATIMRNKARGG